MALAKQGYLDAYRGKSTVKVGITADGYIAREGDIADGQKTFQVNIVNAVNGYDANNRVNEIFLGICGAIEIDSITSKMQVTWGAV